MNHFRLINFDKLCVMRQNSTKIIMLKLCIHHNNDINEMHKYKNNFI